MKNVQMGSFTAYQLPKFLMLALAAASLTCDTAVAADADAGLAIAEKWCNSCHSIGTEQRQEDAGPLFTDLAKEDEAYLESAINRPHDFMPDFPSLTDEDKANVIAYIHTLR